MGNKSSKIISGIRRVKTAKTATECESDGSKVGSKRAHAEEMTGCHSDEEVENSHSPERFALINNFHEKLGHEKRA